MRANSRNAAAMVTSKKLGPRSSPASYDDWARDHEVDQFTEEGTFLVHRVEAFGLLAGHLDALRGDDAQAGFFQHLGDRTGEVAARGIGLDDRKGAGNRHGDFLAWSMRGRKFSRAPLAPRARPGKFHSRPRPIDSCARVTSPSRVAVKEKLVPSAFSPPIIVIGPLSSDVATSIPALAACSR